MRLLSRRQLQKSSSEWQLCVLQSLKVLMSDLLLEKAIHKVDEVIVASLPLLFVGRHGNKFTGSVADALANSALARDHPMLGRLQEVLEMEGMGGWVCVCGCVGVYMCVGVGVGMCGREDLKVWICCCVPTLLPGSVADQLQ